MGLKGESIFRDSELVREKGISPPTWLSYGRHNLNYDCIRNKLRLTSQTIELGTTDTVIFNIQIGTYYDWGI